MTPVRNQILEVLQRYLSEMNAQGTLDRALRESKIEENNLAFTDIPQLLPRLERRARLYLDPVRHTRLSAELALIGSDRPSRKSRTINVAKESDISDARLMARAICEGVGAKSFIVHKVVTIVSELARNIVHYTPGGTIDLAVIRDKPARVSIVAVDSGPGILNYDLVMSGNYRSKTGMGRGLLGIKRLAERCTINPGPPGARIEIEVYL
jgi:serine/threonine-protein kinase RsbT